MAQEEKDTVAQIVESLRSKRDALFRKVEILERRLQQIEGDLKRAVVTSAEDERVTPSRQMVAHAARKPPRTPRSRGQAEPHAGEEERHSKDSVNVAGSQVSGPRASGVTDRG